ncbi:dTDP-4-dehydrorhamnose reductase [Bradyrhizobium sp. STM 3562]|uniref:dTDP-4-dehydrorhamnose reductase n=1 Tax=Bradyrhizobium sp. STM 3562 TaxID=578924 RepID=UPI003890004B
MKMLLLGKDGQLGRALQRRLQPFGQLIACGRAEADLERVDALTDLVGTLRPDVIVNAAAYTAVDKAESEPERARLVNSQAVAALARCVGSGWLIHFSTDFIFDGLKQAPYVETDEAKPLSVYGATKLEGEQAVTNSGCKHFVFRVSWVYAPGHNNFPAAILRLGKERANIDVVSDQVGAPTSAGLIAEITANAVAKIAESGAAASSLSGVYHLAASGEVGRADLARFIVAEARQQGAPLALAPEGIRPIATADYRTPAARPLNSRLRTTKLEHGLGVSLPPWQLDMRKFVADVIKGNFI